TSAQSAVSTFSYPQKLEVIDLTHSFDGLIEAVFYGNLGDPYPSGDQPHVGVSTVNITITNPASPDPSKKLLIIVTTQPLFDGFVFQPQNLDFRSRYVFINAANTTN